VIEGYRTSGDPASALGSEAFEVAEGERKTLRIDLRAPTTITGRLVIWPEMTPRANIDLDLMQGARQSRVAGDDGRFQFERLIPGQAEIYTYDADGEREEWLRDIPVNRDLVDVGDLAFVSGKRSYGGTFSIDGKRAVAESRVEALGLAEGDAIVSIDGHPVATLSPSSLAGLIETLSPDVPVIVVRRGESQPRTVHRKPRQQ
jgi:hypothetical protein